MNPIAWVIILVLVVPTVGLLVWLWVRSSFVTIPTGRVGLLLVKGRATDTALGPGPHIVPALRRKMVEEYPSTELTFRAGAPVALDDAELEHSAPALSVTLGDRTVALVAYTVRFRVKLDELKAVHERFGPSGLFGVVRDESAKVISRVLGDPEVGVDNAFGKAREETQEQLADAIRAALADASLELADFVLGSVDLGRAGAVIQAAARSRLELEAEEATAATRLARARNDAELLAQVAGSPDQAWRYREPDLWGDLMQRAQALNIALRTPADAASVLAPNPTEPVADSAAAPDQASGEARP